MLIQQIKDGLYLYCLSLYKYSFKIEKRDNIFTCFSYSSVNKYPVLNKALENFIIETYKEFIQQDAVVFIDILDNKLIIEINYINTNKDEFKLE